MSIASELDSTIENIKSDYEGLENIGADLTNVNKNIQNIRTCLDNIYTNLPKTTGEGSNLSLNTLKGRINVDDILGDTTQEGTPTPSSPQDINVVTGTQEVVVENKNLFDGIMEQNGISGITGENEILAIRIRSKNYTKVSAPQYTLSIKETGFQTFIYCYDKDKNYLGITAGAWNDIPYTFNTLTNTAYVRFTMKKSDNSSISPTDVSKIQLELGSTSTSYIEHQEQTKTLHLSSKNLFDKDITPENYYYNASGVKESDPKYFINQTYNNIAFSSLCISFSSKLENALVRVCEYNASGTFITRTLLVNNGDTLSLNSATKKVIFSVNANEDINFTNLQIEKGSTATTYEPYYNYELAKIGTYQDRIYKEKDKWYKKKRIEKYQITGSNVTEGWNDSGVSGVAFISKITNYATTNNKVFCTHFKGESNSNGAGGMQECGNNTIAFGNQSGSVTPRLYIKKTDITTLELRTLLQELKPDLYYALETPQDIEITNTTLIDELNELEKMMSYNGQTNISVSGNLPMILDISALKGE